MAVMLAMTTHRYKLKFQYLVFDFEREIHMGDALMYGAGGYDVDI